MNAGDSEASSPPRPEPHVLITGSALRSGAPDLLEIGLRRMGLQPQRIGGEGPAAFRLALGRTTATIDVPGGATLTAADPADRGTNSLATNLPPDWAGGGTCWRVTPAAADAVPMLDPAATREFFKLVVLLIDLFDASHIFWSPARLWSDAPQFRAAVAEMLASGMPPVLHLIAFRRRESTDGEVVATRGLAAFAGQELEAAVPPGWTMTDMVKRLARLALDLMLNGSVREEQTVGGLLAGERVRMTPQGDGAPPPAVRVDFERAG
ncbi:hypothetical protein [Sphingopyxis panaciterrulae]|uniref:DUF4261 domain-containing protein n=1 Tax=Sphingopyxis panaciterrulae TaxID=462372 RepID=A0A7W9B552_9SPHN|nr:hypothetical protein [Sphingopyxis panaciterrulae]MBB5706475.1 hypothetical protein [Sphingopyxis panaciterrulae]